MAKSPNPNTKAMILKSLSAIMKADKLVSGFSVLCPPPLPPSLPPSHQSNLWYIIKYTVIYYTQIQIQIQIAIHVWKIHCLTWDLKFRMPSCKRNQSGLGFRSASCCMLAVLNDGGTS